MATAFCEGGFDASSAASCRDISGKATRAQSLSTCRAFVQSAIVLDRCEPIQTGIRHIDEQTKASFDSYASVLYRPARVATHKCGTVPLANYRSKRPSHGAPKATRVCARSRCAEGHHWHANSGVG